MGNSGTVLVQQCGGTVWWNSETVLVEQWNCVGGIVEQWKSVGGTVWCNSGTVEQ